MSSLKSDSTTEEMEVERDSSSICMALRQGQKQRNLLKRPTLSIFSVDDDEDPCDEQPYSQVLRYVSFSNDASLRQTECFGVKLPTPTSSAEELAAVSTALKDMGNDFAENERFADALKSWDVALRFDPTNGLFHELKAQVYLCLDCPRLALHAVRSAEAAAELLPFWAEGHLTLARAQLNLGEIKLALESFSRAANLDPENIHPEIRTELVATEELYRKIERERSELSLDRNELNEILPPLRRTEDDALEVERCMINLATRPGYCSSRLPQEGK